MTERDIFFLAMIGIVATTLIVFLVQFIRSRRGGRGRGGNWWDGPWDEDDRR